ncbi:hypothetical protein Mgra_00000241 [Meloidogyne graminicola]|uniref:Uncharacterized protein n=1 Tax=Meloidogyne graminicola TaxID=189291 RepID=A0A8T0A2U7_9BILA|nr:hypothetical protein Mgra_00000241 [Meloidogyne graminicola]
MSFQEFLEKFQEVSKSLNNVVPNELLFEILKSINGYPYLVTKTKKTNSATKQQSFVWKIKLCENVLVSSQIANLICGEAFKKILTASLYFVIKKIFLTL